MERIIQEPIEVGMKESYLDYAMSVIVGRAIPDIQDGLKPVHRRIIYSMYTAKIFHNKPFKKSARVVGDVLGKYHPHGDAAIYDTIVRMAQNFSMRYPLIDGQGNFGSIDGDAPAAMRYTEVRLSRISEELLKDIEKDTVDFVPNFDGSLKEPVVLPSRIPNILINGSSGIAVGMSTNIPPHNLTEVMNALIYILDNKYLSNKEVEFYKLLDIIKGPDFPTGGVVMGKSGLITAYKSGKGIIKVRGKVSVKDNTIVITEIPYQVTKTSIIQAIANAVKSKSITGIKNIRDQSDRKHGIEILIELSKGVNPNVVVQQMYKHTPLEVTYGIINLVLVDGSPKILGLEDMLCSFIEFRKSITVRRLNYELNVSERRLHILKGLLIAIEHISDIVPLLKSTPNVHEAREELMSKYNLSEAQANAVLDMRLHNLVSLERERLRSEANALMKRINEIKSILSDEKKVYGVVKDEFVEIRDKYGDKRRTEISSEDIADFDLSDLVQNHDAVVILTESGYMNKIKLSEFKSQSRGGKGIIGVRLHEGDKIIDMVRVKNRDTLFLFSSKGYVFRTKVYNIPEGSRYSYGRHVSNIVNVDNNDKIVSVISTGDDNFDGDLVFITRNGIVKRTELSAYKNIRRTGIISIKFKEGDSLISVLRVLGNEHVLLASKEGYSIMFKISDVRHTGRSAAGVVGMRLRDNDEIVSAVIPRKDTVLSITENGYGKRTDITEYRLQNRGGYGIINIQTDERNGYVKVVKSVSNSDEVLITTDAGHMIRIPCNEIRIIGRNTKGVRLIRLKSNERVSSVVVIPSEIIDNSG